MKPFYFAKRKHREGSPLSVRIKTRLALQLVPAATILVALSISIPLSSQTITTFYAPGAGTGPGRGTYPFNSPHLTNPNGAIAGYYTDSAFVSHGFLRDRNGGFTTFDAPGAGTGAGQGTCSFAISPAGEITGYYFDGTNATHGFLRHQNGVITTFDVPGSGTGPFQGTYGGGFTPDGTIMGVYVDAANLGHGFLLDKN